MGRDVAEEIAMVVADLRAGKVEAADPRLPAKVKNILTARVRQPQPVIDASGIYRSVKDRVTAAGIRIYDDFPSVVSPWEQAMICYVNTHGNVIVLQTMCRPWESDLRWETPNDVDWDRVRWMVEAAVWVGGRTSAGTAVPTTGPSHLMQHAVYDDGSPADMHWQQLKAGNLETEVWEMPTLVLNAACNFLSCSNVEAAEPRRDRATRRRMARLDVPVQTIVVRPPGKRTRHADSRRGDARPVDAFDTPLSSVRGGFKHYGPKYGREGLLFGKYEAKIWVPAHARGRRGDEQPEPRNFVLDAGGGDA